MLNISIPTPCHEDWEAMIPNEKGRHCNSCVKTVVDFTTMSDEEIKNFFLNRKEEKVCGRFRTEQLHRITIELPENIFYIPLPFWKKFLAACLLVFSTTLFSCETKLKGDVAIIKEKIEQPGSPITEDYIDGMVLMKSELNRDSTVLLLPQTCATTVGTPSVKVGVLQIPPIIPDSENVFGDVMVIDTIPVVKPVVDSAIEKTGEIKLIVKDSLQTKNPPKADSNNCETNIFY